MTAVEVEHAQSLPEEARASRGHGLRIMTGQDAPLKSATPRPQPGFIFLQHPDD